MEVGCGWPDKDDTQQRFGKYSRCQRAETKVPFCFESWTSAKSLQDAQFASLSPSLSELS